MFSLALDHAVVASAWEDEVGGGSIFSDPHAGHIVPKVSLCLSEIEASMLLPQQPASSSSNATAKQSLCSNGMEAASKGSAATPPVPKLLSSSCLDAAAGQLTATESYAGHQHQLVPDLQMTGSCTAATADISSKNAGPRPTAELPEAKRPKPAIPTPAASSSIEYNTQTNRQCGGMSAADTQCGVVPDAFAGSATPNAACSSCSSGTSLGPDAGSAIVGRSVAVAAGMVPSLCAPAPPTGPQPSITPLYMKLEPGCVPSLAAKLLGTQPSAAPAHYVSHITRQPARHVQQAAAVTASVAAVNDNGVRTRAEALARYREKRARRTHAKKIRYHLRKVNADKRPRVKGRFVKKDELAKYASEAADGGRSADNSSCWSLLDHNTAPVGTSDSNSLEREQADHLHGMGLPGMPDELLIKMQDVPAAAVTAATAAVSSSAHTDPVAAAAALVPESVVTMHLPVVAAATAAAATPHVPSAAISHAEPAVLPELFFGDSPAAAERQLHDDAPPMAALGQLGLDFDVLSDPHRHWLDDDFFADASDASNACHDLHYN